ncbi:hypothetical protein Tco_0264249, partial [Tanacetum coccineum]
MVVTQYKATLNEPSSIGNSSGSGPRCQETIGDTIALTRYENLSKHSNDPLLARGNTHRSGEDRLKLEELMELYQIATKSSWPGEHKDCSNSGDYKIKSSEDEGFGEEDASKQGRINDIDANEDIYLVNVHRDEDMFGVNDLEGD